MITRNTAKTESLVINLVPLTFSAYSIHRVIAIFATAFTILHDFVLTTTNNTVSKSSDSVSFRTGTFV